MYNHAAGLGDITSFLADLQTILLVGLQLHGSLVIGFNILKEKKKKKFKPFKFNHQ
jgi:hypothetical protein